MKPAQLANRKASPARARINEIRPVSLAMPSRRTRPEMQQKNKGSVRSSLLSQRLSQRDECTPDGGPRKAIREPELARTGRRQTRNDRMGAQRRRKKQNRSVQLDPPEIAQRGGKFNWPLPGKEQFCAFEFNDLARSRDGVAQPISPFHGKEDIGGAPHNQRRSL